MKTIISFSDFKQYITDSFAIDGKEFDRLLDEIHSYYQLEVKDYVQQRHHQLKKKGLGNTEIYSLIQKEVEKRRFAAEDLSIRQIRRIIYG
jgi:hypothetical protein